VLPLKDNQWSTEDLAGSPDPLGSGLPRGQKVGVNLVKGKPSKRHN